MIAILVAVTVVHWFAVAVELAKQDMLTPIFEPRSILDAPGAKVDWGAVQTYSLIVAYTLRGDANSIVWFAFAIGAHLAWRIGRVVFKRPEVLRILLERSAA
jgi:hypothetical protein